jgi:hypothetical protein
MQYVEIELVCLPRVGRTTRRSFLKQDSSELGSTTKGAGK